MWDSMVIPDRVASAGMRRKRVRTPIPLFQISDCLSHVVTCHTQALLSGITGSYSVENSSEVSTSPSTDTNRLEPECLPKKHRVEDFHVFDGTHFPGALAREVQQQLQEHTCSRECDNTCAKVLTFHQEQHILEVVLTTSQHERGHALD